jgi:hypothetical protein
MFLLFVHQISTRTTRSSENGILYTVYLNFEQSILKGLLKYRLHFCGMICRNPSETVTRLALLNRHIYNIMTPISKLHVYLFTISRVYNPVLHY